MDDKIDIFKFLKSNYDYYITNRIGNKFEFKAFKNCEKIKLEKDSLQYKFFRISDVYISEITFFIWFYYLITRVEKKVFKYEINPNINSPNSIRNHRLVRNYIIDHGIRGFFLSLFFYITFSICKNSTNYTDIVNESTTTNGMTDKEEIQESIKNELLKKYEKFKEIK